MLITLKSHLLPFTVEGSWVGARARAVYGSADIGSAYSPPNKGVTSPGSDDSKPPRVETTVETVLDIGFREEVSNSITLHLRRSLFHWLDDTGMAIEMRERRHSQSFDESFGKQFEGT